jgi:hypothetical protein
VVYGAIHRVGQLGETGQPQPISVKTHNNNNDNDDEHAYAGQTEYFYTSKNPIGTH